MRVLLFIALFVWNTAIRAQTAKLTDMGTYWMFKSYVSIAMPDGNFLYQYPSYMFPLPKTLKWYTEIPGKLMFILDKKQTIFVEIINTEILNDTAYIPSEDFMIDIISEKFSYLRHERNYKAISSLLEKIDYHKKSYWLLQQNNCRILLFNFQKSNLTKTLRLLRSIQVQKG